MNLHRRILSTYISNGPDCPYDCPESCFTGGCITAPRTSPSHDLFVAAGCLIAASFFLALTVYVVCKHQSRSRRIRGRPTTTTPNSTELKAPVGLDETTIAAIPTHLFRTGDVVVTAGECSVCLSEFEDGELLRLLPKCGHAFHLSCIDAWLREHVNCPICRAVIVVGQVLIAASEGLGGEIDPPSEPVVIQVRPARRSVSMTELGEGSGEGRSDDDSEEKRLKERGKDGGTSKELGNEKKFFSKYRRTQSLVLPL